MASAAEQLAANFNFGSIGKAKELKSRILFTLGALIVARIGTYIPMPGIDPAALAQQIHWTQAYSFMLFALIYTPCVSAIATIQAESRNWRFTTLSVVWPLVLAWCTSWVFYRLANSVWGSA